MMDGLRIRLHPTLDILVREDGAIHTRVNSTDRYRWTFGTITPDGYRRMFIFGKNRSVHRLVAETFIINYENKPTVDHINRVRDDNRASNLRWASMKEQSENSENAINRADYGVRYCDNPQEYHRIWNRLVGEPRRRAKTVRITIDGKKVYRPRTECIKVPCAKSRFGYKWKWVGVNDG